MESKTLSREALEVIGKYQDVPYFNNRRAGVRLGLPALVGKGSPAEIEYETLLMSMKRKVNLKDLSADGRKKFQVDNNIGIDCSGFAYHVLDAESRSRGLQKLKRHLNFPAASGLVSSFVRFLRGNYAQNAGTTTFADPSNSHEVALLDVMPADIIIMLESGSDVQTNHTLVVKEVQRQDSVPTEISYVHSIAWPKDGVYGHGVSEGKIVIKNVNLGLLEQVWVEKGQTGSENFTFHRANMAKHLSLRRLNWFN